jgi:Tol biopolymer transport system component
MQRPLAATAGLLAFSASLAQAQSTTVVSVDWQGFAGVGWPTDRTSLSADGRFVAFAHIAALAPEDTNGLDDVYVRDRNAGTTFLASRTSSGGIANDESRFPSIDDVGRCVVFTSRATNLVPGDTNATYDAFVRDTHAGTTERVSIATDGTQANAIIDGVGISGDGRYVMFSTVASSLVPGDTNGESDVFVHDRALHTTERVSVASDGSQANAASIAAFQLERVMSADGRYVVFASLASNLAANDGNGKPDDFLRDRLLGTTELVDLAMNGNSPVNGGGASTISRDGTRLAFTSISDDIVPGDTNGFGDAFVRDRVAGTVVLASVDSSGAQSNAGCGNARLSRDGNVVVFDSFATNLAPGDTNSKSDVFVHEIASGTTERASLKTSGAQYTIFDVGASSLSGDGRIVTFFGSGWDGLDGLPYGHYFMLRDRAIDAPVSVYCSAKQNSIGCVPVISSTGLPTVAGTDDFFVTAINVLTNKAGVFFWGASPASIAFEGGTLCVHPPLARSPLLNSGAEGSTPPCDGRYAFHFSQAYVASKGLSAGTTLFGQFWSRDPGFTAPNNVGLTDAVMFTLAP